MKIRWILCAVAMFLLVGSGSMADRGLEPRTAVGPGIAIWAVESPTNLEGETDAHDGGAGFCCALTGTCTPKANFQVGELMWFNNYFVDISNGGLMQYTFTMAAKVGNGFVPLYHQPVIFDTSSIPVGEAFTGCTGAPWIVEPELSGQSVPWGSRYIGNGGSIQGLLGVISAD